MQHGISLDMVIAGAMLQGQGARVDRPPLHQHLERCRISLQMLMAVCQRHVRVRTLCLGASGRGRQNSQRAAVQAAGAIWAAGPSPAMQVAEKVVMQMGRKQRAS